MTTKKFPKQELKDLLSDDETDNLQKISDNIFDTSRWSIHSELVFQEKATGKYFRVNYSVGATEQQDEGPFEYDDDEIEVIEVRPVEKMVIVYEDVK